MHLRKDRAIQMAWSGAAVRSGTSSCSGLRSSNRPTTMIHEETTQDAHDDADSKDDGHYHRLHRSLSARQVQMIAIGGTIGTGLFLGSGRSLAQGGPASMLICYGIVGFIVYVTLLLLGEMATQYPVAGECALRFTPSAADVRMSRFFQRIRDTVLLSCVRFRTVMELLVQ